MLGQTSVGTGGPTENSALATSGANRPYTNQRRSDEKSQVSCDYCNKPCHTQETCWKIHGKPANWKSSKPGERSNRLTPANEAESSPFNKEQMDHLLKLLKSNPSLGTPSSSPVQIGSTSFSLSSCSTSTPWIIDSGASDHMTSLSHLFKSYSPCSGNKKIRVANGSFSPIAGKRAVRLSEKIELKSVLHVPNLSCNLFSVSKLSKD